MTGASIDLTTDTTTLTGGAINLTGTIDTGMTTRNLTITASRNITINDDINLGPDGELTLFAGMDGDGNIRTGVPRGSTFTTDRPTFTAGNITLTQDATFPTFTPVSFSLAFPSGVIGLLSLTTSASTQAVHNWMLTARGTNRALSITTTGVLTIDRDINTGSGDLTLSGASISLGSAITLTGGAISLTGAIDTSGMGGNHAFEADASGTLTLNSNINIGTGTLTLNGAQGITLGSAITLTGGAISLTGAINTSGMGGNHAFEADASGTLTLNTNINIGTGTLTLTGATITLGGTGRRRLIGGAITLTGAIDTSSTNNVGLVARASVGALMINSNINTGTGALTLSGMGGVVLGGNIRLSGGAISLSGTINETMNTRNLTIIALGILTLNSSINLQASTQGALRLTATFINIPTEAGTIDLFGTPFTIEFTGPGATTAAMGFVGDGEDRVSLSDALVYTFSPQGCTEDECVLESSTPNTPFRVFPTLNADTSITIDAGANPLTFGGTGDITIEAPTVFITADTIDVGGRNLTITANGGTLTLSISNSITSTSNINLSGASISLGSAITLTGGAISLTGAIDTSSTNNVGLLVNASGDIDIHNNINTGTGNLTLRSATINLRSPPRSTITFEGGVVSLGPSGTELGLIEVRDGNKLGLDVNVTVRARGNIVLNSSVSLFGFTNRRLELSAGLGDGAAGNIMRTTTAAPTLRVISVFFQQDDAFAADAFIIGSVLDGGDIRLGSATAQEIHRWMVVLGFDGGNLSVRGVDGITLTSITTATGATIIGGSIDLRATTINLGG